MYLAVDFKKILICWKNLMATSALFQARKVVCIDSVHLAHWDILMRTCPL